MITEARRSDVHFNEGSARVLQVVDNARYEAVLIAQTNDLHSSFGLLDLTDPVQIFQNQAMMGFITEHVLRAKLKKITESSGLIRFTRGLLVTRISWQKEAQLLEEALGIVSGQNTSHLSDVKNYPQVDIIEARVKQLFETIQEKTGRPINPDVRIDPVTLRIWQNETNLALLSSS